MKIKPLQVALVVYIIICLAITWLLLVYNEHNDSVICKKTLINVLSEYKLKDYNNGDLLIVKNNPIKKGDSIIYYNTYTSKEYPTKSKVKDINDDASEITYILEDGNIIKKKDVIGNQISKVMFLGYILYIFESQIGFLLLIILPILVLFIYEIKKFISEFGRKGNK